MIHQKYFRYVFSFVMAIFMAFIMSGVLTFINLGLVDDFVKIWFIGYAKAFVVAYPCILLIQPIALKITKNICKQS